MSFITKLKSKLKNSSLGKRYQESEKEKEWKEGIRDKARIAAKKESEDALFQKYKKEEVDNMVSGKKKGNALQKLSDAFGGSQGASSKVERMLGVQSKGKVMGTIEVGKKQPKSMTEKILGRDDEGSGMFGSDKLDRMLGSDKKEKDNIKRKVKKNVPKKEFSFSDRLDKMI
jgi:hypothetical protein